MAKKADGNKPLAVPIKWMFPENVASAYANQLVIQCGEHDCYFLFFEARPPLILEDTEEARAKIESVSATCVAKVVVPVGMLPTIIRSLQQTQERYNAIQEKMKQRGREEGTVSNGT